MSARKLIASLACLTTLATAGTGSAAIAETSAASRGGGYDPVIDPATFVGGVDNPYFPLEPGTVYYYEGTSNGRIERVRVAVTRTTKTILGVRCVVVLDVVTLGGKLLEKTLDWYAQDEQGNVWYFGEHSLDYAHGRWVVNSGSWEAGVDGARPGIIMQARPREGDTYRQEHYPGHAEDLARVLGYVGPREVPYGTFENVLVTREWTPLEPGIAGKKYYARGVGNIETRAVQGGSEYTKLVAVIHR